MLLRLFWQTGVVWAAYCNAADVSELRAGSSILMAAIFETNTTVFATGKCAITELFVAALARYTADYTYNTLPGWQDNAARA